MSFFSSLFYLILGIPFLIAGLIKLINPSDFAFSLKYYFNFPEWLCILIAILLPGIEIVLGASIIFNIYRKILIIVYRLLLLSFLFFHIWNYFYIGQKPCNCFGNLFVIDDLTMIIFTSTLLVVSFTYRFVELKVYEEIKNDKNEVFKKANNALVIIIIVLIGSVFFLRWQRIETELNSGLISHIDLPYVRERLNSIMDQYLIDNDRRNTLLIFLRGSSCKSCLDELEFWAKIKFSEEINVTTVFPEIPNKEKINQHKLNIPFKIKIIPMNIFFDIIGKYPAEINRIFWTNNGSTLTVDASTNSYNEKINFLHKIEESNKYIN